MLETISGWFQDQTVWSALAWLSTAIFALGGGYFRKVFKFLPHVKAVITVGDEVGDFLTHLSTASKDSKFTADEVKALKKEAADIVDAVVGFKALLVPESGK